MEGDSSYMLRLGGFFILGDSCFFFSNLPQLPSNVSQNGNPPPLNKNDLKSPGAMSFASKNESVSKIILFKPAKMNWCCDPCQELKGMFILIFFWGIQSCPGEPTPEGTLGWFGSTMLYRRSALTTGVEALIRNDGFLRDQSVEAKVGSSSDQLQIIPLRYRCLCYDFWFLDSHSCKGPSLPKKINQYL